MSDSPIFNPTIPTPQTPVKGTQANQLTTGKYQGRDVKQKEEAEETSAIVQKIFSEGSKSSAPPRKRDYSVEGQLDIQLEGEQINAQRAVSGEKSSVESQKGAAATSKEISSEEMMIQDYEEIEQDDDETESLTPGEKLKKAFKEAAIFGLEHPYNQENKVVCNRVITSQLAEKILEKEKVGSFLFRPSSDPNCIAVSVRKKDGIVHVKYVRVKAGDQGTSPYLYQTTSPREEFRAMGYNEEEIPLFLMPRLLSVYVKYFESGAFASDSGQLMTQEIVGKMVNHISTEKFSKAIASRHSFYAAIRTIGENKRNSSFSQRKKSEIFDRSIQKYNRIGRIASGRMGKISRI